MRRMRRPRPKHDYLPTREDAGEWARKIAATCRCSQELREFMYDPELAN